MQTGAPAGESPVRVNAVAALRRYAQPGVREKSAPATRCELCSGTLGIPHRHLLELATRQLACACDPCALRFEAVTGGRFRLIPRDVRLLQGLAMTEAQWEALALPINLVFFYRHSGAERVVAMYPGPAGATESLLPLERWQEAVAANPELASMEPDVEALLVNRVGAERESFVVPLDRCYELTGIIRKSWRGLSGGDEAWTAIRSFFERLRDDSIGVCGSREVEHG